MAKKKNIKEIMDIIKYPIITDKTTKRIEEKVYYFAVDPKSNKNELKQIIEYIFNVKVAQINTLNFAPKIKKIGKLKDHVTKCKKAIVKLQDNYTINLFEEN